MTKIKIQNRWTGDILFEHEKENNTVKGTVIEAVRNGVSLRGADLRGADLRGADLREADLRGADLREADLREADLRGADLIGATMVYADLRGADLIGAAMVYADLKGADLRGAQLGNTNLREADLIGAAMVYADLRGADLRGAQLGNTNLREANFSGASIYGANLSGAYNIPYIHLACPSDGAFIGWKKVNGYLIKLEIPDDAKRSSATTNKCRCDKARVLSITDLNGENSISEIENAAYEPAVIYKVGEVVFPDSFDENRWNECSHGIHFFINKQDAINY